MAIDLSLPMPAETFIPHRLPMRLVETLVSYDNAAGTIEAQFPTDSLLADGEGYIDQVALVELLAQGYATIKGYDDLLNGKEISKGYLVGIKKLRVPGQVKAGEPLLVHIRTVGSFEGFAVAEGEIERDGEVVAHGTIKLWIVGAGPEGGAA